MKDEKIKTEEIEWKYFFGTKGYRYYKAEINGKRVEKLNGKYSIGNIDEAKVKYTNEEDLIKACK